MSLDIFTDIDCWAEVQEADLQMYQELTLFSPKIDGWNKIFLPY